jgi:hypothetical protein
MVLHRDPVYSLPTGVRAVLEDLELRTLAVKLKEAATLHAIGVK